MTSSLRAADFDHDGRLDLVAENRGAHVLRQANKGRFEPPIRVDGSEEDDIAVADMDGDTLPDLLLTDTTYAPLHRVRVLRNVSQLIT